MSEREITKSFFTKYIGHGEYVFGSHVTLINQEERDELDNYASEQLEKILEAKRQEKTYIEPPTPEPVSLAPEMWFDGKLKKKYNYYERIGIEARKKAWIQGERDEEKLDQIYLDAHNKAEWDDIYYRGVAEDKRLTNNVKHLSTDDKRKLIKLMENELRSKK